MSPAIFPPVLVARQHSGHSSSNAPSLSVSDFVASVTSAAMESMSTSSASYSEHGGSASNTTSAVDPSSSATSSSTSGHGSSDSSSTTESTTTTNHGHGSGGGHGHGGQDAHEMMAKNYNYAVAGLLFMLFFRHATLSITRALHRRRQRALIKEKGAVTADEYTKRPAILIAADKVDTWLTKPAVPSGRWLGSEWTRIRVALVLVITLVNTVTCLYMATSARDFANRTGFIAVANYPILYGFAGRNSIFKSLTGQSYMELRFYHKVIGIFAFLESLLHTLAYVGFYYNSGNTKKLKGQATQFWFQIGCVAVAVAGTNWLFYWRPIRIRAYEFFLITHIIGAVLFAVGSWYHRPEMESWTYAAVGIWVFDRMMRLGAHFLNVAHTRLIIRSPIVQAEASFVDGAIILNVPFDGKWYAGQHVYVSLWGIQLMRHPHLYGQSHPYSIPNVYDGITKELQLVLRVQGGITKTLASHVVRLMAQKGTSSIKIPVACDGPYGAAPEAHEAQSVLLIGGGSGVTHVASVLGDVCLKAEQGLVAPSTSVRFVWAIHHLAQAKWISQTLNDARRRADLASLDLTVEIYVTRPEELSFGRSTPVTSSLPYEGKLAESPQLSPSEEKKSPSFSDSQASIGGAVVLYGRPNVREIIKSTVAAATGRVVIAACGPDALADEVRVTTASIEHAPGMEVEVAKFDW